jgi:hypothetical protein
MLQVVEGWDLPDMHCKQRIVEANEGWQYRDIWINFDSISQIQERIRHRIDQNSSTKFRGRCIRYLPSGNEDLKRNQQIPEEWTSSKDNPQKTDFKEEQVNHGTTICVNPKSQIANRKSYANSIVLNPFFMFSSLMKRCSSRFQYFRKCNLIFAENSENMIH